MCVLTLVNVVSVNPVHPNINHRVVADWCSLTHIDHADILVTLICCDNIKYLVGHVTVVFNVKRLYVRHTIHLFRVKFN